MKFIGINNNDNKAGCTFHDIVVQFGARMAI